MEAKGRGEGKNGHSATQRNDVGIKTAMQGRLARKGIMEVHCLVEGSKEGTRESEEECRPRL